MEITVHGFGENKGKAHTVEITGCRSGCLFTPPRTDRRFCAWSGWENGSSNLFRIMPSEMKKIREAFPDGIHYQGKIYTPNPDYADFDDEEVMNRKMVGSGTAMEGL